MRWPTASNVTAVRSRANTYSRFYLGVQKGRERTTGCGVHGGAGTVSVGCHYLLGATDVYDANEHELTFGTVGILGATDILPGMTLGIGTLADPFLYGSARIRYVNAAADRIYLEPNNLSAEGHLTDGDYIYCDGIYRLYRKLPYIVGGVVYEDGNPDTLLGAAGIPGYGIAFDGAGGAPFGYLDRPVALMGSPRFAWVNESIPFYGWRSHGRGGNTITTYSWDFDDGSPPVAQAGTPALPVWGTWHQTGEYTVRLTVTDNSGKVGSDAYGVPYTQHVAVRPVLVFDRPGEGDNPPYTHFEVKSLRGSYGSGWTASITVFNTADKEEFPDNALVILFAEDWYNGVRDSLGGWYGQEGILFCGYILANSVQADSETSTVTFEAATIEQWMKDVFCWPANFEANAAPTKWKQFADMTCEDVLWYLSEFRSNLKDVTDCFYCSDPDGEKALSFVDITEASLYDQMSEQVGSCFFGQLSASRHGSVHLFKHKNMLDLVERTTWGPPVWVFSKQDWRDQIEVGDETMRDSIAQIDFIGFIYDANGNPQEVYSLAPERQTCFGKIEKVTGILLTGNTIAAAQAESNTLAGLYRAWKNTRFRHIRVPAFNNRFLEPACLDYFGVTLAAADTYRGYVWSAKEWLCTEVNYAIDNEKGIVLADVTGEASTWGPDGVAGLYPQVEPNLPDDNPPEYGGTWPATDPPPWDGDVGEGSEDWEPAAGAWADDNGPGRVWKFFTFGNRLYALAEPGDATRGIYERTGAGVWTKRDPTGGVNSEVYEALVWNNRVWAVCVNNDTIYSTLTPWVDGWTLEWTCPGNETFNVQRGITAYDAYLYVATEEQVGGVPRFIHFHRYSTSGVWDLDFLAQYPVGLGPQMDAYDFVKYGWYWWSGSESGVGWVFRQNNGGAWADYTTNLEAGKFTFCHGMYFVSSTLGEIWRGTGGGWLEDYDPADTINSLIALSVEDDDNLWIGAEIDAANIEVHCKWWGEDWRTILPSCADTWAGAAIRGPDGFVYLAGNGNIWRFVPA